MTIRSKQRSDNMNYMFKLIADQIKENEDAKKRKAVMVQRERREKQELGLT